MKTQKRRVRKMKQTPMVERLFFGWSMNPWTPEQAAKAIRRHPEQMVFWRSCYELRVDTAAKMKYPEEDMSGVFAADWRVWEGLVNRGCWEDFLAKEVQRTRKGRSRLVFLMVVRRNGEGDGQRLDGRRRLEGASDPVTKIQDACSGRPRAAVVERSALQASRRLRKEAQC